MCLGETDANAKFMPLARFSAMTREGRMVTENAKVPSSIPGRTNPLSTFSKKQKFLTYRTVYLTTSYGGVLKIINSQIEPLCSSLFVSTPFGSVGSPTV